MEGGRGDGKVTGCHGNGAGVITGGQGAMLRGQKRYLLEAELEDALLWL